MLATIAVLIGLTQAPEPPSESPSGNIPCDASLRTSGIAGDEFAAAARLRLPELRLRDAESQDARDESCRARMHAYVEVRASGPGRWELIVIFADGRAWFRPIESEPDEAARTAASALANLLAAIEDDALAPDAEDVALPPEVEPEPEAEPEDEVEPEVEVEPEPEPEVEPTLEPERPIVLEVGVRVGGQSIVGLRPSAGHRAMAGELGLDLRLPSGLMVTAELRAGGWRVDGASLLRLRPAIGLGYGVRSGRFDMPIVVQAQLEPWWVRDLGVRAALDAPPLLGGGLRLAPGLRVSLGQLALRLGARVQLDVMGEPLGGRVPVVRREPSSAALFHVGGVELALGLELALWIPVRERE